MRHPQQKRNSRIGLYITLLAVTLALMYMLRTCSTRGYFHDTLKASGGDTIDVAIEYSPMSLYNYDDTLGGFGYDLMRHIASAHGLTLKFHPVVSLTRSLDNLDNGTFDILIAQLPMTSDLGERFLFTKPVYLDRQVLVQKVDSMTRKPRITTQLDLAGDTLWVVANSPLATRIANLSREIGDTIYVIADSVYTSEQLTILTAIGEIGPTVVNERIARAIATDYPMLDLSTGISFTQFQSWLVNRNDSTLRDSLDSWIETAKASETYRSLELHYLR